MDVSCLGCPNKCQKFTCLWTYLSLFPDITCLTVTITLFFLRNSSQYIYIYIYKIYIIHIPLKFYNMLFVLDGVNTSDNLKAKGPTGQWPPVHSFWPICETKCGCFHFLCPISSLQQGLTLLWDYLNCDGGKEVDHKFNLEM